jgi:hypothetical protein
MSMSEWDKFKIECRNEDIPEKRWCEEIAGLYDVHPHFFPFSGDNL